MASFPVAKREVLPSASPTPFQRLDAPLSAFGGDASGIINAGAQLQRAGDALAQRAAEMQVEDDVLAVTNALTRGRDFVRDKLDNDIYARSGSNAMGAINDAKNLYQEAQDRANTELVSPVRQRLFARHWDVERDRGLDAVSRFEARERKGHIAETTAASVQSYGRDALAHWNDPQAVQAAIGKAVKTVNDWSDHLGEPAEKRTARVAETKSSILASVIKRTADADYRAADALLAKRTGDLVPEQTVEVLHYIRAEKARQTTALRDDVQDAVAVLGVGKVPPNLGSLARAVEGTDLAPRLNEAVEDRTAFLAFRRKPLADQAAELKSLTATETMDRRQVQRMQHYATLFDHTVSQLKAGNGLALAADLGVINDVPPIVLNDPATLVARRRAAEVASQHFGVPVEPFTKAEAGVIADKLDNADANHVVGMLPSLKAGFGHDGAMALAGDVVKKRPEMAMALVAVDDRPDVAREMVQGGRLIRQGMAKDALPAKADRASLVENHFGDMFTQDTAASLDPILAAADAVYVNRRVPTGDLTFDTDTYEKALADVAPVTRFNGRNVLLPSGVDAETFDGLIRNLDAAGLKKFGSGDPVFANGAPFTPDLFKGGMFRRGAQLVTAGPGRYLVWLGDGFIQNDAGGAFVLDVGRMAKSR